MNVALILGIVLLACQKLTDWHGRRLILGVGVCTVYVVWGLWETRTSLRDSRAESVRSDRWTFEAYALAQGTTALSALAVKSCWPCQPIMFFAGGTILFCCGVVLRVAAVRELGQYYSHRVQVTNEHRVIQTGPYRCIRHPAYTGMLLAHLGLSLVFFNWVSLGLLFGALMPALLVRIVQEERTLSSLPSYVEFCRSRARIVPYVW
jgi:protein-S-isoprenylcysteine O-methyltransferase Ste14